MVEKLVFAWSSRSHICFQTFLGEQEVCVLYKLDKCILQKAEAG